MSSKDLCNVCRCSKRSEIMGVFFFSLTSSLNVLLNRCCGTFFTTTKKERPQTMEKRWKNVTASSFACYAWNLCMKIPGGKSSSKWPDMRDSSAYSSWKKEEEMIQRRSLSGDEVELSHGQSSRRNMKEHVKVQQENERKKEKGKQRRGKRKGNKVCQKSISMN